MNRCLLILFGIILFCKVNSQSFYATKNNDFPNENTLFVLNVLNCDSIRSFSCPPTNNIQQYFENIYSDIAIDSQNIYYVSGWGSLYSRKLNDTTSCQFLGVFNNSTINALTTDINGTIFAAGNQNGVATLYKYNPQLHVFSTIGNLPPTYFSSGDLFFYEGKLFLTATNSNFTNSFLVEVNVSNPSQSCYYMNLQNLHPWSAFSIKHNLYSEAFVISTEYISAGNYTSTLFKLNLPLRTISSPICVYPFAILGAATVYDFTPSIKDSNSCYTLPIQLLSFYYFLNNKSVELVWKTTSENNNDYFLIEKSLDGNKFEVIGKRKGAINSNTVKQYSFIDNNPSYTNYYRLKQVDIDGKFTRSNTLFVKTPERYPLHILQNPVFNNLNIQINLQQIEIGALMLCDFSGRVIRNFTGKNGCQTIDVSSLTSGAYIIQLRTRNGEFFIRQFIKT